MIPRVDGRVLTFAEMGLYDGLVLLGDAETGTVWHHLTGEGLHGELAGRRIEEVSNIYHTTVEKALESHPDIHIAISDRPIRQDVSVLGRMRRGLSRMFLGTMSEEDDRRPTMDIGLGLWKGDEARYYAYEDVLASNSMIFDTFAGRRVLVFYAPDALALLAVFTDATSATWEGDELHLSTGEVIRHGVLYDAEGNRSRDERPLQVFTRWYGFSLTWPQTVIYERDRA